MGYRAWMKERYGWVGKVDGVWEGRMPEEPWQSVRDPFQFIGDHGRFYPPTTGRVVDWLKVARQPTFTRVEAQSAARFCDLAEFNDPQKKKRRLGLMIDALECLEWYDYIRSFNPTNRTRGIIFVVNPVLLGEARDLFDRAAGLRAFTHEQKRELWFSAGGKCCICRVKLGPDWHADHVHPWSKGGLTVLENGQALCPECNHRKHAKVLTLDGGEP